MNLSTEEIEQRVQAFIYEWKDYDGKEIAESQTFWNELFNVFGKQRKTLVSYEESIKKMTGNKGRIDVFWPGELLAEQKGPGVKLDETVMQQALGYVEMLPDSEKPKKIVLCNFQEFKIIALASGEVKEFRLEEFGKYYREFLFIAGYSDYITYQEEEISLQAAELLAKLYTSIEKGDNKPSLELNYFMVRLLYCFFADHTELFSQSTIVHPFHNYLEKYSNSDGRDLHSHIRDIFEVLNTPKEQRDARLNDDLKSFPYVNGELFSDTSYRLYGNKEIRDTLLEVAKFNWSEISPAIFGTLFQSITNPRTREIRGEHYTSETNILKALKPLFLHRLEAEYETIKDNRRELEHFIEKLSSITVLDPACGSGNFLVVAYRELRQLELNALQYLHKDKKERHLLRESIHAEIKVNVNQFYGIEIEQLPSKIAQLALWLTDHQMNMQASSTFGFNYTRLPLTASATIYNDNALTLDWNAVIPASELNYIVGNPPFLGYANKDSSLEGKELLALQKKDKALVFANWKNVGTLDYVACWYKKSVDMMKLNPKITCALVSTNSITQGVQVFPLWYPLITEYGLHIHFAHRTFKWFNEAKGKAQVHCVVIGFGLFEVETKHLWDYELGKDEKDQPTEIVTERRSSLKINPYLVFDNEMIMVKQRSSPLDPSMPNMFLGSIARDGTSEKDATGKKKVDQGFFFTAEEKEAFLAKEPEAKKYFRQVLGADEFLNAKERYCLWLADANPVELAKLPEVVKRVNRVEQFRLASKRASTRKLADRSRYFGEIRQPTTDYLLIPRVSSEHRVYSPIGYVNKDVIITDSAISLEHATPYIFGVLSSRMHQVWLANVAGRMKSDFRYSNTLVYNTFPFPHEPTAKAQEKVEKLALQMLAIRQSYLEQGVTLAQLYNKESFRLYSDLVKVHRELDKAVEACYRKESFDEETNMERISFLFSQYQHYTDTLFAGN
ncbi:class I SAM-dependent DNA methyltransferase [Entomospira culicis]|uniref:site-specific DNA-methyltransferase (adenine-specific) n=1 Tax=Entomospira culicis TaxID=2719989 RepID=A0A968GLX2_9SPIO|nr:DNA methyltransferase [Entomospira culicis]NIZ20003.1 class I SAM-dependent DNA methyltransferase [Entomospira culicis]NIZ70195.1 class I SAM-dependent DNA methyltransferase [Entomospira culicis]WDI38090.1 N-6 DNA methylase [Entomospira culicis]WDI39712.1 N-6 DNA methylase [Entomospira culicis]